MKSIDQKKAALVQAEEALEWVRRSSTEDAVRMHVVFGVFGVVGVFREIEAKCESALAAVREALK